MLAPPLFAALFDNVTSPGLVGGSPGLVVMGGDSRLKGRGFESWHRILDGHDIFHIDLL